MVTLMAAASLYTSAAFAGRPPAAQPIMLGTFGVGSNQLFVPLSGAKPVDTIFLDNILLFSGDPNENGEGEPLILFSACGRWN